MFGSPSTLPLSSCTDGTTTTSAAPRYAPTRPAAGCRGTGRVRDAARARPLAQLVAEVAVAGDREDRRPARPRKRVDEVLEALLAHQPSGGEQQRDAIADAELTRRSARAAASGGSGRRRRRTARSRAGRGRRPARSPGRARSSLHAVTNPARRNTRRAATRAGAQRLGDEDVGAVQADDERQRRRRGGGRHAAGDDPVPVHDRRADAAAPRAAPRAIRRPAPAAPRRRRRPAGGRRRASPTA